MNRARRIAIAAALAVLLVGLAGSYLTRGVMEHLSFLGGGQTGWSGEPVPHGIVDQRPWQTAETLAGLAVSAEEKELAREAERLADHEVDQAFSQSLRQASAETRPLKGEALRLQQRVNELQQTVKDDQAKVTALTPKVAAAPAAGDAAPQEGDDLDVAKAQLGLDQNELADSLEDLARESGDQRVKIQQELSARQAAMKKYEATQAGGGVDQTAVEVADTYRTLAGQIAAWRKQRTRLRLLAQAEGLAQADVAALTGDHDRMEAEAKATEASAAAAKLKGETGAEQVKQLQYMASQRNILSIVYDRLGAQQQLAALYLKWTKQVRRQHRIVLHLMLQSVASIASIALGTMVVGWLLLLALDRMSTERRQKQTLRTILNLGTQLVGLLLVLLVVFGSPEQMPTILGLATAGLTVVFQDFILAFCGWFVLMGRNGIRVGDWVEIDGVGGEVVELGLFRTWLLETGNWTANGHPTGRRVSFLNGYAIRGKYFNFSTAGQWMWDEIKVSIPADVDASALIEKIRVATVEATAADATMAEAEWKRVTHEEGLPQFSATPAVDMRPAGAGVDIVVRYVTRAGVRLETRNKLFGTVVDLMKGMRESAAVS
ncbi:Small-conductance mechanosensitive channel [Granulicella rosea]|uniref:Small-conductance mechanosensitive channel n=1 Tax=Granulicella rosea TaxID=474952 RepID=A0A239MF12_9BACT|nr:mechanosensitive ion channel domain-containing protein [Granulicella rosea]SNT41275.1 Small-conductance mechanosensitive channel [Granulicella rosea]